MAITDIRGASLSGADPPIATNPNPDLAWKAPVRAATTGSNITLSGLQTIDGIALNAGDRVLVKDQTDETTNGLYNAQTGPWTLTIDANNNSQWTTGTQVAVASGSINGGNNYKLTAAIPVILGTTLMTFGIVSSTSIIGANPTAKVGLAAVNGTALTVMRSDAAPPIDQTIAPTWTGLHTFAAGVSIAPAAGTTQGLSVTQTGAGTVGPGFSYNPISITDNLASGGNQVDGVSVFMGMSGSAINGPRSAFAVTLWLVNPTSASNSNREYTAASFLAQAIGNDGGTLGSEKGLIFGCNPVATLSASSTHMVECSGVEVNTSCALGSSTLVKYGVKIVQSSTDAVQGSTQDAALVMANQGGAVGWGTLWQIGDGVNANPLVTTGTILALKGSPTIGSGIDLTGAGTISNSAFKSPGFSVSGAGLITSGANGGTGGQLTLEGATSGSAVLGVAASGGALQLGLTTLTVTQAANTSADGLVLADSTAASSGNQQFSPRLRLTGQGWKTASSAASQETDWIIENQPVQGSSAPTSNLVASAQINGGGYTAVLSMASGGGLTIGAVGAGGQISLNGSTSGAGSISVSATAGTLTLNTATINSSGGITTGAGGLDVAGGFGTQAPTTLTGTSGTVSNTSTTINSSGTFTATLPAASGFPGEWLFLKNAAAHAVNSASSNVVPLGSTSAGTAIFGATATDWAALQSDGTNWQIMAGVTT